MLNLQSSENIVQLEVNLVSAFVIETLYHFIFGSQCFCEDFGTYILDLRACYSNVRALTVTSINRIKHPNIAKISQNRITAASPNERNTEADEQSLLKLEEQLFIRLRIK